MQTCAARAVAEVDIAGWPSIRPLGTTRGYA